MTITKPSSVCLETALGLCGSGCCGIGGDLNSGREWNCNCVLTCASLKRYWRSFFSILHHLHPINSVSKHLILEDFILLPITCRSSASLKSVQEKRLVWPLTQQLRPPSTDQDTGNHQTQSHSRQLHSQSGKSQLLSTGSTLSPL